MQHLGILPETPTLSLLNQIMMAWAGIIPWESASRIAQHQRPGAPEDHARLPDAFIASAVAHGTGGTCFESNFALGTLLTDLSFQCQLAFCDMENEIENPHA
jgi:arylamine N-acetyltransferase